MRLRLIVPLILVGSIGSSDQNHKFYVSTTSITVLPEREVIHISSQVFIDDMEFTLQKNIPSVRLNPDSNTKLIDSLTNDYYRQRLTIDNNGNPLEYNYVGRKYNVDVVTYYFELPLSTTPLDTLQLKNSILFESFKDQKNIVHFKLGEKRKSRLLKRRSPSTTIILSKF